MSYLVPCPKCGTQLPVELGMSGETLRCSCGSPVEVPTLRVLRDLPRTDEVDEGPGWTWRHGVMVLGAMLAVFGIAMGLYLVRNQYQMQPDKEWDNWQKYASVADDWKMWRYFQRDGISGGMNPQTQGVPLQLQYMFFSKLAANQKLLDKQREWIYLAWAVGAFGLLMMAATLFFPARTKIGLPGLKSVEMTPTKQKVRR
jgi:hypothetical protein